MRHFSPEEKNIIDYLCGIDIDSKDVAISSVITKFCPCSFICNEDSLTIFFNEKEYSYSSVMKSILEFVSLFEYLTSEGLIFVFARTNVRDRTIILNKRLNHDEFGDGQIAEQREISVGKDAKIELANRTLYVKGPITGINPLSRTTIPWELVNIVRKYANYTVYCTDTLRHIKNQDYKDDATVQYEENRCQTWIAIGISLIVGIGSMCVSNYWAKLSYNQNIQHHRESLSQSKEYILVHDTILVQPTQQVVPDKIDTLKSTADSIKSSMAKSK